MKTERWCFTDREFSNPEQCRSDDEFMADISGPEFPIIVYRNGKASFRSADGTVGPSEIDREAAEAEETLYTTDGEDCAELWRSVHVNDDGSFHAFVGCLPDHDNIRYCRHLRRTEPCPD